MKPMLVSRTWSVVLRPMNVHITLIGNTAGIVPTETLNIVPWFPSVPRQIYICAARCGHQVPVGTNPAGGQFAVAVDYGRRAFNAGVPPWYQEKADGSPTDWDENTTLVSLFAHTGEPQERTRDWPNPVFFDADQDVLWVNQEGDNDRYWFQISYLAPSPDIDVLPYPAQPQQSPWLATAGPVQFDADSGDYAGYTFSVSIDADSAAGSKTRVTIAAAISSSLTIDSLMIGPRVNSHTASELVPMIASPLTLPPGSQYTAEIPQGIDGSSGYVIRGYVSAGKMRARTVSLSGWSVAYKAGDFASQIDGSDFVPGTASSVGVSMIEQLL